MSAKETTMHLATETGVPIKVIKSSRRTRSSQGRWVNDHIEIRVPAHMSHEAIVTVAHSLANKVLQKRDVKYGPQGHEDLAERADRLSRAYFNHQVRPKSVRWVTNQGRRWGSANYSKQTINLSHRLWGMPDWVIDAVLVHELAHLIAPDGHGPAFKARIARYPRTSEADVFLLGFSHGRAFAEREAQLGGNHRPGDPNANDFPGNDLGQMAGLFDDDERDDGLDIEDVEATQGSFDDDFGRLRML
ncbi:M48 metallopeptidase family protein [Neomicrococcus lactis]